MAMILRLITSDGSENTVDLADGVNTGVMKYTPKPPATGATSVTESAQINLFGTPVTYAHRTQLAMIARMFSLARARKDSGGKGTRVYLQVETSIGNTPYRSEIYDGVAPDLDEDTFGSLLASSQYIFTVSWTRAPWFEGSETQIALTNGNGTNNTSGLTINNSDDTGRDNWFNIPTTELLSTTSGDIETPIKLEITNTTTTGTALQPASKIFIGMTKLNGYSANRVPMFEGENGTAGAGITASNGTGTTALSNSAYKITSWDGTARTILTWSILGADLNRMKGQRFIPIVRFATPLPTADMDFSWNIVLGSAQIKQNSIGWTRGDTVNSFLQLIGGEIPPYLTDLSGLSDMSFILRGQRTAGGTGTVTIDSVHLMPADKVLGGFRKFTPTGYGFSLNGKLIDNGIEGQINVDDTANGFGVYGYYYADGDPLMIRPNSNNQFYIFQTGLSGDALATRTVSVKAYYRPRRATL